MGFLALIMRSISSSLEVSMDMDQTGSKKPLYSVAAATNTTPAPITSGYHSWFLFNPKKD